MHRLFFLFVLITRLSFAQTTDYSDVAVIINDNTSESEAIALYFKQARNIPAINMIHISAPVTEIIDSAEFEVIRAQIEDYLVVNNLVDSINYLVTTKGVPMRVERAFCSYFPPNAPMNCTTVESELTLLLSQSAGQIGYSGSMPNPYHNEAAPFDRENYGIYLVTRLDGYAYEDVIALIDNSGPNTLVNPLSTQHIFDLINMPSAMDSSYFGAACDNSIQWLQMNGWMTQYDGAQTQLNYQSEVVDLVRYDYFDAINQQIEYSFVPGSVAEIVNTAWNFSFDPGTTQMANHLPSLISLGLTGGHTYAYSTYFSLLMEHRQFAEHYFSGNYNLAEALYTAIPTLSSVDLVLGDPKTSIEPNFTTGISSKELPQFLFGPNPVNDVLTIIPGKDAIQSYALYAADGRQIVSHADAFLTPEFVNVAHLAAGTYILELTLGGTHVQERIVIQH